MVPQCCGMFFHSDDVRGWGGCVIRDQTLLKNICSTKFIVLLKQIIGCLFPYISFYLFEHHVSVNLSTINYLLSPCALQQRTMGPLNLCVQSTTMALVK